MINSDFNLTVLLHCYVCIYVAAVLAIHAAWRQKAWSYLMVVVCAGFRSRFKYIYMGSL